jgi:ParB family chromosome partitioning protein
MSKAVQKITLNASRDIPFDKLVLSQSNVRRLKAGLSIEELAEDIGRRSLLQSLSVRPVLDADGKPTGMFEVPAGGRRFRALELLVKQKRLARNAPVPCIVREEGIAEEDSLAENVQRVALHPLDQFQAFKALIDKGVTEEEIAARFFVTVSVVKQRLRLAAVSQKLLDVYGNDGMTLEQLMAFTVTGDHARQEQVWESVSQAYNQEPYLIRRYLTEGAVRASDRRVKFVGLAAYEAAGGATMRDLFQDDDGGWLQDPALLDRLVLDKLKAEAEALRSEGWKWIAVAADFPYGHANGLRRLKGDSVPLSEDEQARLGALCAEYEKLEADYADADELPEEIDQRLGELEEAITAIETHPIAYDPADRARAGVFVSIGSDGHCDIERGYVRPEDEPAPEAAASDAHGAYVAVSGSASSVASSSDDPRIIVMTVGDTLRADTESAEDDDAIRPLSDRLVMELTAHRTLALRDAVAADPDVAFLAVLHALCLASFHFSAGSSCLEITARSSGFTAQAPGLKDTGSAKAIDARHKQWEAQLPEDADKLWSALAGFDSNSRAALFAHCASLTVNVTKEPGNRRPAACAHGDELARAAGLDMVEAGWRPTADNYLGRVSKLRILEAVREAKGERAAQLIDHLKKGDMAREAERLLEDTGWLPEPLRSPEQLVAETAATAEAAEALPDFLAGDEAPEPEEPEQPQQVRLAAA